MNEFKLKEEEKIKSVEEFLPCKHKNVTQIIHESYKIPKGWDSIKDFEGGEQDKFFTNVETKWICNDCKKILKY